MALNKKPVTGMKDILPAEMQLRDYCINVIKETYGKFGFTSIETPCVESIGNLNSKQGGENEKLIFKILKRGEKLNLAEAKEEMDLVDGGILLGVSGYYTCTNISLPTADAQSQASAESPQDSEVPQESPQDGDDAQQLDAASAPAFEPIQNPQLQSFYASVFFDGESWSVAE